MGNGKFAESHSSAETQPFLIRVIRVNPRQNLRNCPRRDRNRCYGSENRFIDMVRRDLVYFFDGHDAWLAQGNMGSPGARTILISCRRSL
jgi:hypothetical protein